MAITFVQSASTLGSSQAFASDNTAGNLLLVFVGVGVNSSGITPVWSVSDTQGNVYSSLPAKQGNTSATWGQLFYTVCAAGANTVSVGGSTNTDLAVYEFSGVNTLDQHSENGGSGNTQTSNSVTTTQAAELLFGYMQGNTSSGFGQQTVTGAGSPWTTGEFNSQWFLTQYQIVSSTGTFASTSTTTVSKSSSNNWMEGIATFYFTTPPPAVGTSSAWLFGF